ncbi:pyridoxal phosphate biosynthetic protein [Erythrobacter ani]|uniref:Pyridoxal phosphate biosynthetic protein n=1 Tax=Erythrobacter ani TaxID=2827235 RepID=A0ABS6SI92_9SPHN|nr:pyridoxal phosphate biosynthetic protein [Erythrobacter ani]MBV7264672.1 pyridoxal phosphate biosynthetic protein [Erythrobacter ani]
MDTSQAPELTSEQKRWAFFGSTLFLTAVGFLGYALGEGAMILFAAGWVALQIFGFVGSLRLAKGDFAQPLFKSQVFLHVIVLMMLMALVFRSGG